MSIVRAFYVIAMRFFQAVLNLIRNVCGSGRNKKRTTTMDDIPFEVVVNDMGGRAEEKSSLLQNEAMDSWDDTTWDKKEEVNEKIEQWRQTNTQKGDEKNQNPDDDLFSTLEPTITSARKVILKPRGAQTHSAPKRDLFQFNEANMGATSTLENIDDYLTGWGDDLDTDLKQQLDSLSGSK